jgi:hypothetical protein
MRSLIRSIVLVAAVSAPLAALAATSGDAPSSQSSSAACVMSGSSENEHAMSDRMSQSVTQLQPSEQPPADQIELSLGGQNGWPTSFNSPG